MERNKYKQRPRVSDELMQMLREASILSGQSVTMYLETVVRPVVEADRARLLSEVQMGMRSDLRVYHPDFDFSEDLKLKEEARAAAMAAAQRIIAPNVVTFDDCDSAQ